MIPFSRTGKAAEADQATARGDRIGQTRHVSRHDPIVSTKHFETFDAKPHALLARKRSCWRDTLNGAGALRMVGFGLLDALTGDGVTDHA